MSPVKEKPAPLVPEYVDLSSLEYMPLYIAKLRGSKAWLICKRKPELAYYLQNLWMAAWQERPAGSIEADDDVLCEASRCSTFEQWVDLKSDLLRGWILCSDGRYYCRSMVPMVQRGWKLVTGKRKAGKAGAEARWGDGNSYGSRDGSSQNGTTTENIEENSSSHASRYGREGGREGRKEGKRRAHAPQNGHTHPREAFLTFAANLRAGTDPVDPITLRVVEALGGMDHLRSKSESALVDLMRDFENHYAEALR